MRQSCSDPYFDDVERDKLRQIASDLKNTAELHTGEAVLAPMVFSLNGGEQGLEDELRKRIHVLQAMHALDPTLVSRERRSALHKGVTRIQKRIGTSIYAPDSCPCLMIRTASLPS